MYKNPEELSPGKVFHYFCELAKIPHGSYNTTQICKYCEDFAKARNLEYVSDNHNNIVIYKKATKGYENSAPVIIQGHLDMVAAKTEESMHDFLKDPLKLSSDGKYLYAEGTTLGGDDGIAIAYALAILDSDDIEHAPLEAVFTSDEEVGLLGAKALDMSLLKGKYMLNIDSEDEGVFLTSSAGGLRADMVFDNQLVDASGESITITVKGLQGGHSGTEIDKGRANAHILMGRILNILSDRIDYSILDIQGGTIDNAITKKCEVTVIVDEEKLINIDKICLEIQNLLRSEYKYKDDNICVSPTDGGKKNNVKVLCKDDQNRLIFLLNSLPNGVIAMSSSVPGLVETSLNCGVLKYDNGSLTIGFSLRSSNDVAKRSLADKLKCYADYFNASYEESGDYPAWPYKPDSKLREIISSAYQKQYGEEPRFEALHAGLECGIFSGTMKDLDIVSFGPNMSDIHTPDEKLDVESTERVYNFIIEVLKELK